MSSYEEKVFDQQVDRAWTDFVVRLGDRCAASLPTERFHLDLAPDVAEQPCIEVERVRDLLLVAVHWPGDCVASHLRTADVARHLGELGFYWLDDMDVLEVDPAELDVAAHAVGVVLRDLWGAIHPVFVHVLGDDAPELHEEPEPVAVPMRSTVPDSHLPTSREDLQDYVHAVLQARQHAPLKVADDGAVSYGDGRTRARVWVASSRRVEVWTILARDVRRTAARREVDRLSLEFPSHRFYVVGRRLIAEVCLDARPLIGAHLERALQRTIGLHHRVSDEVQENVSRRPRVEPAQTPDPDHVLLALAAYARDYSLSELVEMIETASDGDPTRAEAWLVQARVLRQAQREHLRAASSREIATLHHLFFRRWGQMVRALTVVTGGTSADEDAGGPRSEAS